MKLNILPVSLWSSKFIEISISVRNDNDKILEHVKIPCICQEMVFFNHKNKKTCSLLFQNKDVSIYGCEKETERRN
jgi:hypothetical protein